MILTLLLAHQLKYAHVSMQSIFCRSLEMGAKLSSYEKLDFIIFEILIFVLFQFEFFFQFLNNQRAQSMKSRYLKYKRHEKNASNRDKSD